MRKPTINKGLEDCFTLTLPCTMPNQEVKEAAETYVKNMSSLQRAQLVAKVPLVYLEHMPAPLEKPVVDLDDILNGQDWNPL